MVNGNLEGLKKSTIDKLENLYGFETENSLIHPDIASILANLTGEINREIAVYIDRKGKVTDVSVGNSNTVSLSEIDGRRDIGRLSGIRCIHTHPNGTGVPSSVDLSTLIKLRLDCMISIGVNEGTAKEIYLAFLGRNELGQLKKTRIYGPFEPGDTNLDQLWSVINRLEKDYSTALYENKTDTEKAILVGLEPASGWVLGGRTEGQRSLDELEELARTAGAEIVGKVLQKRSSHDPAYFIGSGKIREVSLMSQALNADLIIFDNELSGAQIRNIENITGIKVIDRTALILDIFASRARSREGKLQVELAQLKYRLPRLLGLGVQLSRLGGGIGTRGPGEKKLETDRRHINRKITAIQRELKETKQRRNLIVESRKRSKLPAAALVGYTNAGKSTLLNKLCRSDVFAENKLFATLDPTTRNFELKDGRKILLTDTVGFIRKLPHELVEAFKSTLEETISADILLHVIDASNPESSEHIKVVEKILEELGTGAKPIIRVFNKIDLVQDYSWLPKVGREEPHVFISAEKGQGIEDLLDVLEKLIPDDEIELKLKIPFSEGWVLPFIYKNGEVFEAGYDGSGSLVTCRIKRDKAGPLKDFMV